MTMTELLNLKPLTSPLACWMGDDDVRCGDHVCVLWAQDEQGEFVRLPHEVDGVLEDKRGGESPLGMTWYHVRTADGSYLDTLAFAMYVTQTAERAV